MKDRHANPEASIAKAVAQVSDHNREWVRAYLERYQNRGNRAKSARNVAHALLRMDKLLGRPFQEASANDWQGALARLRTEPTRQTGRPPSELTVHLIMTHTRCALKEALEVKHLPGHLDRATKVREPRKDFGGYLLTETDFRGLLEAAAELAKSHLPSRQQAPALLWFLWDSGTRISEAASLRIGDLRFHSDGIVVAGLPPDAEFLKTGPRQIPLGECGGALRLWLDLHPAGHDPSAPLWLALRCRDGRTPAPVSALRSIVDKCAEASGLNARLPSNQHLKPHDFRHTCATRKARADWPEAKMRHFFGWKADSDMPSRYIHLAQSDIIDQVRRDAGIDNLGYRQALDAGDDLAALRELMKRLLQEPSQATTRRPWDWQAP